MYYMIRYIELWFLLVGPAYFLSTSMDKVRLHGSKRTTLRDHVRFYFWNYAPWASFVLAFIIFFRFNLTSTQFEANDDAYFEAQQVCNAGAIADCRQIALEFKKGLLTMRDHSEIVEPAFARIPMYNAILSNDVQPCGCNSTKELKQALADSLKKKKLI